MYVKNIKKKKKKNMQFNNQIYKLYGHVSLIQMITLNRVRTFFQRGQAKFITNF